MSVREMRRPSIPVEPTTALAVAAGVFAVQLLAVVAYLRVSGTELLSVRYTLYPLVWITLGVWVLLRRPAVAATARRRLAAAVVAIGYFLLLATLGGLLGTTAAASSPRIAWLSPGWGPALFYSNGWLQLSLLPFEVVGYLALSVLVYTVLLGGAKSALAGVMGVATCVGCVWPLGVAAIAALGGTASPIGTTAPGFAYDLSTLLFVVTAALLYWAARRLAPKG